jgi:hypothetical protein
MGKIIQPTYPAKLPSTGQRVSFRPFTVKEEKALLLALQENDAETVICAIENVISICTDGKVDPSKVPYYDVEALFLQIRSKSVGEVIDLIGSCECDKTAKTPFSVDIGDMVIEPEPIGKTQIKIPDTPYSVEFAHPTISDFSKTFTMTEDSATEVVSNCIKSIYTEDEILDWSDTEKFDFVESMSPKQQKDIAKFLDAMPMVKLKAEYNCNKCGKLHTQTISGFESFFL